MTLISNSGLVDLNCRTASSSANLRSEAAMTVSGARLAGPAARVHPIRVARKSSPGAIARHLIKHNTCFRCVVAGQRFQLPSQGGALKNIDKDLDLWKHQMFAAQDKVVAFPVNRHEIKAIGSCRGLCRE